MFPGQETPHPPAAGRPLRTFTFYRSWHQTGPRTVRAHYITYAPGHVVFMEDRPGDTPDRVVLGERVDCVHHLTETATP